MSVAPQLDAKTAVSAGMAAGSNVEAVQNAAATANLGQTTNMVDGLRDQPISAQLKYWHNSDSAQQSKLASMGYKPPPDPATTHPSDFWGHMLGDVKGAVSRGVSDATSGVSSILSGQAQTARGTADDALSAIGAPLRFVQHGLRSLQVLDEHAMARNGMTQDQIANHVRGAFGAITGGWGITGLKLLTSPSEWARDWRETNNGEQTFDPAIEYQIKQQTNPVTFKIAKALASGDSEAQVIGNTQGQQKLALVQAIQSPEVKDAVQQLNAAHLSVGRAVVGQRFIVQHPALGKDLSGGIDAAYDVLADPTMHTGGIVDAARLATQGVTGGVAAEHAAELTRLGQPAGSVGTGEAVRAETYSVPTTTAYYARLQQAPVQRWFRTIGDRIESSGITSASELDSRVLPIAQQLSDAGVHDAQSLAHWFAGQAGLKAVMSGEAATTHAGTALLPSLTPVGLARMQAKGLLSKSIDWLSAKGPSLSGHFLAPEDVSTGTEMGDHALDELRGFPKNADEALHEDGPPITRKQNGALSRAGIRVATFPARLFRRIVTLTPTQGFVDSNSKDFPVMVKRMLQYSLPAHHVNQLTDMLLAATEEGEKREIYRGAVKQMLVHAGVYGSSERMAQLGDEMMATLDDSFHAGTYAPGDISKMSNGDSAALLPSQMSSTWYMPSYKEVRMAAKRDAFYNRLGFDLPDTMDKAMKYWKAAVLLRVGFAVRVALSDEAFSNVLRHGLPSYLMARAAVKTVRHELEMDSDGKIASAVAAITNKIPAPLLEQVQNVHDLASLSWAHTTHALYRATGGSLTLPEYLDGARSFYKYQWEPGMALRDQIASVAHGGASWDPDAIGKISLGGGKAVDIGAKRSGIYGRSVQGSDPLFNQKWWFGLNQIAHDPLGRTVLENLDKGGSVFQRNRVLEAMEDPAMEEQLKRGVRWNTLADGRVVGRNATREDALKEWASKIVKSVHASLKDQGYLSTEEAQLPEVRQAIDYMLERGTAPDIEQLEDLAAKHRLLAPRTAYGPEWVSVNKPDRLIATGFHGLSKIIDWISREPMTLDAYTKALHDTRPVAMSLLGRDELDDDAEQLASDMAAKKALEQVKPYIHSPEIRSQFEVIHRTAMPFLFAQDQFIKRWGRTFIDSPDGIRKAQLTMQGLQNSGFITTNSQGEQTFAYPGSQYALSLLARTLNVFHLGATLPVLTPFTGEVTDLMPGLQSPSIPSVGPTVAVVVKGLTGIFPELQPAQQVLLQEGASTSYWDQILPPTLSRLILAVSGSPNTPGEFASAMMQAMQLLAAGGHGLPENANAAQKQQYLDRVTSWTRTAFFFKALLGFIVPASPTQNFDPKNLDGRLQQLFTELPTNEAIAEFIRENPDATPYTVFDSSSAGDVPNLPSTQGVQQFMSQNGKLVSEHPLAAGWFVPRTLGNEPFDPSVYREQISYGMRNQTLPVDFLTDLTKAAAASTYYASENNYYTAYNQVTSSAQKTQMRTIWDNWQANFMAQNPTFANYVTDGGEAQKRADTLRDIQSVLDSNEAPEGSTTQHVATLMEAFGNYEQAYASLDGNYSEQATQQRDNMETTIQTWAAAYTNQNPDVSDLWNTLLVPELGQHALTQGVISVGNNAA